MNSKIISQGILRAILILGGVCLLAYVIYLIQSLIVYVVIAAIISLMGRPVLNFFKTYLKLNNTLATIITMVIFQKIFYFTYQ